VLVSTPPPPGLTVEIGGQNEELQHSYRNLQLALLLAIFLVYLVMAAQFESFLHPFIILFTVPLGAIGVILTLLVFHKSLSVVVFIGVIMLAGIVVNNAIVLIDYINQLRARGVPMLDAVREAAGVRLRPILMTTLTTVLGLLPMALGLGEGAEIRSPMALTVIGGLLGATVLTLLVIPALYTVVTREQR
jgi:HAE1 family hydrophobic/amphiphilic exporter-1